MVLRQYEVEVDTETRLPVMKVVRELDIPYFTGNVDTPEAVFKLMKEVYRLNVMADEWLYLLTVNKQLNVVCCFMLSKGTQDSTVVSVRDVFYRALVVGAHSIILVHNHPTGDISPSKEDDFYTNEIALQGKMFGLYLVDHIIVGGDRYYSYVEDGKLKMTEEDRRYI